jgi:hypothetical protein
MRKGFDTVETPLDISALTGVLSTGTQTHLS